MLRDSVYKRAHIVFHAHVSPNVDGLSTLRPNLPLNLAAEVFTAAAKANPRPFRGECNGGRAANSGCGARHDHDLSLKAPFRGWRCGAASRLSGACGQCAGRGGSESEGRSAANRFIVFVVHRVSTLNSFSGEEQETRPPDCLPL